jgi:agmatinase
VLGGDHSAPYGAIKAVAERWPGVGILHVDAHADLRQAYMGFRWSHASIFHNVLELEGVGRLVGVGYRDVGTREWARIESDVERIKVFSDPVLAHDAARGRPWLETCREIVAALPKHVYVSFDIDGLDPTLCPSTGTPVPGGLSFREATMLLEVLSASRQVVGFDLCEVAPGPTEWDANVGARLLYRLAGCAVRSLAAPPPTARKR